MSGGGKSGQEIFGAVEIVVGALMDVYGGGSGNALIAAGIATELAALTAPNAPTPQGQGSVVRGSVENQQILYGQVCTGGVLVFGSSYGSNGSQSNAFMVIGVSHSMTRQNSAGTAGMPVDGIVGFYLNDIYIPLNTGSGGWNSGRGSNSGTGSCAIIAGGSGAAWNNLPGNLWISFSDGSQTTADPVLTSNFGTIPNISEFIGYGNCYSVWTFFMSAAQDTFANAFPQGINTPGTIKAVINGQLIYDPRLDSTNGGSGTQRLNNTATWTFSSNTALVLADYLTRAKTDGGAGYSTSQIDWSAVAAAANICDESINVPQYGATWNGSTWSATDNINRYTFNGALDCGQAVSDNVAEILKSMAGYLVVQGNIISMYAGATGTSVGTIDESYLGGQASLTAQLPRNQMYNAVRFTYGSEPQADNNMGQGVAIINSSYETQDGGVRLYMTDHIKGCNNQYACQILEITKSRQSRNKMLLNLKCNMKAAQYQAGDLVTVNLPEFDLNSVPYRIIQYTQGSDMSVQLTLRQENSNTYTLPAIADGTYQPFTTDTYQALYSLTPSAPAAPTGITASATGAGNLISWSAPNEATFLYEIVYRSTSPSSGYTPIARVYGNSYTDTGVVNGTLYYYYVTAVNYWSQASAAPSLPVSGASCTSTISAANATQNQWRGAWNSGISYNLNDGVSYTDGNQYLSLSGSGNLNKPPPSNGAYWLLAGPANLDAVANGATYGKVVLTALTSGNIDFSKSGFANKNLDNINDTATYNRHSTLEFDGLHFYDHSAAQNANSQASYKSAVTGLQQNLVPDSDIKYGVGGGTYWTITGTLWNWWKSAAYGNGPYSFLVYGTGAPFSGNNKIISTQIPIITGVTYTFSFNISGTANITGGTSVPISIINQGTSTTYASVTINSALGDGRKSVTFTASATDNPAIMMNLSGLQISSGAHLTIGQFQLELGSKMTGYRSSDDFYGYGVYAGSGPVSIPTASFTYTSSCPSGVGKITWSWSGMGYYNADGSETTIANGSNTQTSSLAASTTYYFYPYVNLPSSTTTILWMAGGTGSTGYAYTAKSAAAAAGQNNATNIPLSSGGMAAATPASGGGGGGGGGGFGCLHPSTPITINGRVQPAGNLHVGDLILTPDGEQEVIKIRRSPNREWRRIRFTDEEILVTPSHRFMLPDGGLIAAEDIRVKELIQGSKAIAVVTGIDYYEEAAEMVSLEVKGGYYLARAGGAVNKNGTIKP